MKIDNMDVSQSLISNKTKKVGSEKSEAKFDDVLRQHIKATPASSGTLSPRPQPVSGLQPVVKSAGISEPVQTVERVLDTVAHYQNLLKDPAATMRIIEPAVRHMKIHAASLDQFAQGLSSVHPLRQVLEETQQLVREEIERFDSGYYVDP